jgi:hypothetical protein
MSEFEIRAYSKANVDDYGRYNKPKSTTASRVGREYHDISDCLSNQDRLRIAKAYQE